MFTSDLVIDLSSSGEKSDFA